MTFEILGFLFVGLFWLLSGYCTWGGIFMILAAVVDFFWPGRLVAIPVLCAVVALVLTADRPNR